MKKIFQSLLSVAAVASSVVSVSSCSGEDEMAQMGEAKKVPLEIVTNVMTRSLITGTTLPEESQFGIFAMNKSNAPLQNGRNARVNYIKGKCSLDNPIYLTDESTLIYAYYPYKENVENVSYINIEAPSQTDYLYANTTVGGGSITVHQQSPQATLNFRHALSRITFKIKKSPNNTDDYNLQVVGLSNMYENAILDLRYGSLAEHSGNVTLQSKIAGDVNQGEGTVDMLVIPIKDISDKEVRLSLDFEKHTDVSVPMPSATWESGKQYTYTVTIEHNHNLSITEADITPWEDITQKEMEAERIATSVGGTVGKAVDLGLSVKWASWNVGASAPEERGGLYGWADPTGAKWSRSNDDFPSATPPFDIQNTDYDIAHVQWGKEWFIPSYTERRELVEKCKWTRTTLNGVDGYKVESTINGNSIFLPCTGYRDGSPWFYSPSPDGKGCYWTSTGSDKYTDGIFRVNALIWEDNSNINYTSNAVTSVRYYGYAVRPVTKQ